MKRNWNMNAVSDGKLYHRDDMVLAGCNDCKGCSDCCHAMGTSIVLDPYDIYRLMSCFSCTIKELMEGGIELNVVDGLILPNVKMNGREEACFYLTEGGRCSIHPHRPGICRLFPLGRIYEENGFHYFLQIHECKYELKTEVRVSGWMDTPNIKKYERFVLSWHKFLKRWEHLVVKSQNEQERKQYAIFADAIF